MVFTFRSMNTDDLPMVLRWRASDDINQVMLTEVTYDLAKQRLWFDSVSNDSSCRYWIIEHDKHPIGVLNQSDIHPVHKRCSWGFYIGESDYKHLGGLIPPYFYNHVFLTSDILKLTAEVLSNNAKVMKLHRLHGYRSVGVYQSHIKKNDQWFDLHLFELAKDTWLSKKRFTTFKTHFY